MNGQILNSAGIVLTISLIGRIVDYFINKNQREQIYDYFLKIYLTLKDLPIKKWEERVANFAINFFDNLLKITYKIISPKNFEENIEGFLFIFVSILILNIIFLKVDAYWFTFFIGIGVLAVLAGYKKNTGYGFNFILGLMSPIFGGVLLSIIMVALCFFNIIDFNKAVLFDLEYLKPLIIFFCFISFLLLALASILTGKKYGLKSVLPALGGLALLMIILPQFIVVDHKLLAFIFCLVFYNFSITTIFFLNIICKHIIVKILPPFLLLTFSLFIILFSLIMSISDHFFIFISYLSLFLTAGFFIILNIFIIDKNEKFKKHLKLLNVILFAFIISITFTLLSLCLSTHIPVDYYNCQWLIPTKNITNSTTYLHLTDLSLKNTTIVLLLTNFPFDFLTISISIFLLKKFIIEKKWEIIPVAAIDIAISGILAFLSYLTIKFLENYGLLFNLSLLKIIFIFILFLANTYNSIKLLILDQFSSNFEGLGFMPVDIHLMPVIFTSFIPVFLYMFFLSVMSASKLIINIIAKFFEVFIEQEHKLIFTQLATFIGLLTGLLKTILIVF